MSRFRLMSLSKLWLAFTFLLSGLLLVPLSQSVSLDRSGNYRIVVAIDEKTLQNSVPEYVSNIKRGFSELSEILHFSTESKFSIQAVDIIIPSHWTTEIDGNAALDSFITADVKVSHVYDIPSVDNPNPCGRPGNSMFLPYDFFNYTEEEGRFGDMGRALLTQFVRLRFGAWQEHGYVGDSSFPYFWKDVGVGSQWDVNACSNSPLNGKFQTIDDGSPCDPSGDDVYPPKSNCRFIPDLEEQTANSSLMGFHHLSHMEEFCDAHSHNRKLPNPQNFFCKYKSVREVIEESDDWKSSTEPNVPTPISFRVLRNSETPLLYILLDGGISQAPSSVLSKIAEGLKTFLNDEDMNNTIVAVGKYPADEESELLTEIVPWTFLEDGREQIYTAIDGTFGREPGFRDFGGALHQAIRKIKERENPSGGIVLILKNGIETQAELLTPQSEVLIEVIPTNVKICAIELKGSEIQPGLSLELVSSTTDGLHLPLSPAEEVEGQLSNFFTSLKPTLQSPIGFVYVVGFQDFVFVTDLHAIEIRLASPLSSFSNFAVPVKGTLTSAAFKAPGGNMPSGAFVRLPQWGSSATEGVFSLTRSYGTPYQYMRWGLFEIACTTADGPDCVVLLYVFVKPSDHQALPDVKLEVSTSAENGIVDLFSENAATVLGTPFAIYGKLTHDNVPLRGVPELSIKAIAINLDNAGEVYQLEMTDDGKSLPDVVANDGIFSATFVPKSDGVFKILMVAVYNHTGTMDLDDAAPIAGISSTKLFPIDQENLGCVSGYYQGCWSETPLVTFVARTELSYTVEFRNRAQYVPMVNRIVDFQATPQNQRQVQLSWTAPGIVVDAQEGLAKADSYEIKYSSDFDELIYNFENANDALPPNEVPVPGEPGTVQTLIVQFDRDADLYFAMKARTTLSGSNAPEPVLSVISGASIRSDVIATTTTTVSSTRPSATTSEPPPTTTEYTGSTIETTGETTTTTTERRTSSPRTTPSPTKTTARTTKVSSTSTQSTATEKDVEHWFETKEGIITIGVLGGGILLLLSFSLFIIYRLKNR